MGHAGCGRLTLTRTFKMNLRDNFRKAPGPSVAGVGSLVFWSLHNKTSHNTSPSLPTSRPRYVCHPPPHQPIRFYYYPNPYPNTFLNPSTNRKHERSHQLERYDPTTRARPDHLQQHAPIPMLILTFHAYSRPSWLPDCKFMLGGEFLTRILLFQGFTFPASGGENLVDA